MHRNKQTNKFSDTSLLNWLKFLHTHFFDKICTESYIKKYLLVVKYLVVIDENKLLYVKGIVLKDENIVLAKNRKIDFILVQEWSLPDEMIGIFQKSNDLHHSIMLRCVISDSSQYPFSRILLG